MDRMLMGDDITLGGFGSDALFSLVGFGVLDDVSRGASRSVRKLGKEATEELTEQAAKQTKKELKEKLSKLSGKVRKESMSFEHKEPIEPFLPDEYYENLNKNIQEGYQPPNTREIYRRLGNTSHEIETSIVISDDFGRIKYRIDYSTHGNAKAHTNPHIHEFIGSTFRENYQIREIRYFIDENTGRMRPGKANNDGTYRWLD